MFCGFWAILLLITDMGTYTSAAWWIIIAGFLDGLDGKLARLTRTSSKFGVEFDSLADLVSFGMAPALLIYRSELYKAGNWGIVVSFFFLLCGGIRLARFNTSVKGLKKENFVGLPIPVAAGLLASFTLFHTNVLPVLGRLDFSLFLALAVSFLMVSTIEYSALPKIAIGGGFRENLQTGVFIGVCMAFIVFPDVSFFIVGSVYIITGIYHRLHHPSSEEAVSIYTDRQGVP